jgi:pimeloyl-ACP methyl ester carboxylesterase
MVDGRRIVQQLAIDRPAALRRIVLMNAPAPGRSGVPVPADIAAVLSGAPGTTFASVMRVLFLRSRSTRRSSASGRTC